MDMNAWTQYQYDTENEVVQSLIQEEINLHTRCREQVSFRCVSKKQATTSIFWGVPTLVLLLIYWLRSPLDRNALGIIPIITLALIWLIRVCMISKKNAAKYMVRDAKKAPETPFGQLVSENMQEQKSSLGGSKMVHILLCVAVMLGTFVIPITDRLEEMHTDGMIFRDYRDGCILVDCEIVFNDSDVVIPEQVEGKTVVAIDSGAFMKETSIRSIHIPETVTSIGGEAFAGCSKLESVTIPRGVTEIRGNCFENCTGLQQVTLHEGITSIHGYAFRKCSALESITLPSGITEIRGYCFEACARLKSIVIPEGVTRIGAHAFMDCASLESVTVPSTVREIGSSAFRQCPRLRAIAIPGEAEVNERAFKDSPTEITTVWFTEEQEAAIDEEINNRTVEELYFAYETAKGKDQVSFYWEEGMILIADDQRFAEKLSAKKALSPLENKAELFEYLNMAKEQGAEKVRFIRYSQVATDIKGRDWYVSYYASIEEMIAWAEET